MNKLSAASSGFYKKFFPALFFGFLGIFYMVCLGIMIYHNSFDILFIVVPPFMALMGYFIMQDGMIGLADEVFDCGKYLLIRNNGKEFRVELSDIVKVEYSYLTNPPLVYLNYKESRNIDKSIKFSPPTFEGVLKPDPAIEKLILRIEAAKK